MRVLHVAETAKGGVGSFLDELIPLQQAGIGHDNVRVVIPGEHRDQLRSVGDAQIVPFSRPGRSLAALSDLSRRLDATLAEFRPDVLHLHSSFAGLIGRIGRTPRVRPLTIYNPHGWAFEMWSHGPRRALYVAAERILARRCDRIVAVSSAEREQGIAVGLPPRHIAVVRNGIDMAQPSVDPAPWPDKRLKILFIGRLDRQKGFDTMAAIAARNTDTMSLRVIGLAVAGSTDTFYQAANIEHLGWLKRDEITSHLLACDVVAMPSRWEGLPISALEAMRAAKPIVAFAVGGLAETVAHGETGYLLEAGDLLRFEQALLRPTREAWNGMGAAARVRFQEQFSSDRMAREFFDLYSAGRS